MENSCSLRVTYNGTAGPLRGRTTGDFIDRVTLEENEMLVGARLVKDASSTDYLCRITFLVVNREGSLHE